jgi:hypothetical protein
VAVVFGLVASGSASAERYRVDLVAQVGTMIDGYTITELGVEGGGPYSISDRGEIAFIAGVTGPGYTGFAVMTDRRIVAKIGDVIDGQVLSSVLDEDGVPAINRHGQVSYRAFFNGEPPFGGVNTLVFDNQIIAQPGMNVGGHVLGTDMSQGAALDDLGRALFWATTANSSETGVPNGLFCQHGLLWSGGPQQVHGEDALAVSHFVSRNGQHRGMDIALSNGSVPVGYVHAIATVNEILLREGQILEGNLEVHSIRPHYITDDGEILAVVHLLSPTNGFRTDFVLLPGYTDIFTTAGAPRDRTEGIPATLGDGRFAYLATMLGRPGRALFVGEELIVAVGDRIGGKVLSDLGTTGGAILSVNSHGNVVLSGQFTDGTAGYITATVIPEPSTAVLAASLLAIMGCVGAALRVLRAKSVAVRRLRPASIAVVSKHRGRRARAELLESRSLLAGFDINDYVPFSLDRRLETPAVIPDISGAAYVSDANGENLYLVRNTSNPHQEAIYHFALNERLAPAHVRTIALTGFFDFNFGGTIGIQIGGDTEGITYLGPAGANGHEFAIVEERIGHINILTILPNTVSINKATQMTTIVPNPNPINGGNDGLEGISFRPNEPGTADDQFYVAKESDGPNRGVWQMSRQTGAAVQL